MTPKLTAIDQVPDDVKPSVIRSKLLTMQIGDHWQVKTERQRIAITTMAARYLVSVISYKLNGDGFMIVRAKRPSRLTRPLHKCPKCGYMP